MTLISDLPSVLIHKITNYMEPTLELRCVSRKYLKKYNSKIMNLYIGYFYEIEYLRSLRIRPTYKALCIYFKEKYCYKNKTQCNSYTKKGIRCKRYCYDKYCHQHIYTINSYKNSKMFHYLSNRSSQWI